MSGRLKVSFIHVTLRYLLTYKRRGMLRKQLDIKVGSLGEIARLGI